MGYITLVLNISYIVTIFGAFILFPDIAIGEKRDIFQASDIFAALLLIPIGVIWVLIVLSFIRRNEKRGLLASNVVFAIVNSFLFYFYLMFHLFEF